MVGLLTSFDTARSARVQQNCGTISPMTKLVRDPGLDQLVQELNQAPAVTTAVNTAPAVAQPQWPPTHVPDGHALEALLAELVRVGGSDLLIFAGSAPVFRIAGRLSKGPAPLSASEIQAMFNDFTTSRVREQMDSDGSADFSIRTDNPPARFRVNLHRQRGTLAAAFRALPNKIPTLGELNLPPILAELVKPTRGLVLMCGPTGAGKSTTLSAMVGEINRNEARHIITVEDPIEYEHDNVNSVIEQIEIGRDAPSFAAALRAALRRDPDVILVGEMRDLETVSIALTAAETGHLILSTLHTSDAAQAIHRVIDVFPPAQQSQIKHQLAMSLNAVVCQQLIPRSNGDGRSVAVEVLLANNAVRNHIRSDKLQNLISEITLGKRQGMISLEDSLVRLVQQGAITAEDARIRSARPDEFDSLMRHGAP
jgi:twitching motility protein PilT